MTWSTGTTRIALVANYRRQDGRETYSIGPSLQVPILRRADFEIFANADFAQTDLGHRGFIGLSLRLNRGRARYSADAGARLSQASDGEHLRAAGRLAATIERSNVMGAQVQATASLERQSGNEYASLQAEAHHRLGYAQLGLIQPLSGLETATQYGITFGTNLAARDGYLGLSGTGGSDAMIVARVDGAAPEDRFDVLVNNVPVAALSGAKAVSFPVPSYRAYDVRLKARGTADLVSYDTTARRIGLYPGNVASFAWSLDTLTAVFGRLVDESGQPVADASLIAGREVANTDETGTFLIQLAGDGTITAHLADGRRCTARPGAIHPRNGYAAIGDVSCHFE